MSIKSLCLSHTEISSLCRCNITDHFDFDALGKESMPAGQFTPYNDLSVEQETPNTLQYEDRHDQSRADNDK